MRKSKGRGAADIGLSVLILALVAGCAPQFIANPQLQEKLTSIKTVAIMPPNIKVYQIAFGDGVLRLMDEETAVTRHALATAIATELGRHAGVVFKPFPSPLAVPDASGDLSAADLKDELEDTQALFEAVSDSILLHIYGEPTYDGLATGTLQGYAETFLEKLKNFDYSLGPDVQRLAKLANADALLFISVGDFRYSVGLKAAAFFFSNPLALAGPTSFSVALVDATTGALLWYNVSSNRSRLTSSSAVAQILERVFDDFPLGTKLTWDAYDPSSRPTGFGPE